MKAPLTALALALSALTAVPAAAEQASLTITHRDLDLATPEGQAKLDRRIEEAARKICGLDDVRTGTRTRSRDSIDCFRQAKAEVKQQVAAAVAAQQRGG